MDIGNRHVCEAAVGGLHIFFVQLVTLNLFQGGKSEDSSVRRTKFLPLMSESGQKWT